MSPTWGLEKRSPIRLTSTRWPTWSVGTIDSLGIRYGLTRKAWMPRASPRATATIRTSSRSEPDAEWPPLVATGCLGLVGRRVGGRLGGLGPCGLGGLRGLGLGERLLVDGLARHLGVLRRGRRGRLGRRVVEQPR